MSDSSYSKVIEIPCTELTGFSVRLEVVKSHMEGDTMVLDEVKLIDVNYDGSQPSVTEEET